MEGLVENISEVSPETLKHLKDLYRAGLFKTIIDKSQEQFGPFREWQNPDLRLIGSRALLHTGLGRTADAAFLRLGRGKHHVEGLCYYYLSARLRCRGPLEVWKQIITMDTSSFSLKDQSHILAMKARIAGSYYRDFELAESILDEAKQLYSNDHWLSLQTAYLSADQDELDKALKQSFELACVEKYLPALQFHVRLLQQTGKIEEALALLAETAPRVESAYICEQIADLYMHAEDYQQAEYWIDRLKELAVEWPEYAEKNWHCLKSDLYCVQGKYEEAMPYLALATPYYKCVSAEIKKSKEKSKTTSRKILDVPFIQQRHMTCAPASIAMVMNYWGIDVSQQEIAEEICYDGTPALEERRWIENRGFKVVEFELEMNTLKTLIDLGFPVMLATVEPGSAHLQVIAGYDEAMGAFIIRDPNYPRLSEMLVQASCEYYASSGPRCVLAIPAEKENAIDGIDLKASALYDAYHNVEDALDKHQRKRAIKSFHEARSLDLQHRLTIASKRLIAFYDQDEREILACTEILLSRYPDDVNLQISKLNSLFFLGSETICREYYEELYKKPHCHYLIKSRLADNLRHDHRERKRVEELLSDILRINPLHPQTLYAYAGFLWDDNVQRNLSYQLYRFVSCLEDKYEGYALSYFKAARFFKETDKVLGFLTRRHKKFLSRSSAPAKSLFSAYEMLNRDNDGFQILEEAMAARDNDGDLILFSAEKMLHNGKLEESIKLANKAKPYVKPVSFLEIAAEISERKQDFTAAISCWQKILKYEPVNHAAVDSLMRIYVSSDEIDKAKTFIDEQLERYPNNYQLLRIKANHLDSDEQLLEETCKSMMEHHGDDEWAFKRVADLYLSQGRFEEALNFAKEALAIKSTDTHALTILGKIYSAQNKFEQAKTCYERAITLSCDCIDAYEPLLQCAMDVNGEKESLSFIHNALLNQVSFGEGILHYQELASRWLTHSEITAAIDQALTERPDLWETWVAKSNLLCLEEKFTEALELINKATDQFPLLPKLYIEQANIHLLHQSIDKAEESLKSGLAINPGWGYATKRLVDLLDAQGRFDEAIDLLNSAIKQSPFDFSLYGYSADLYHRMGNKQKAIVMLEKAIDLDPAYQWAWTTLIKISDEDGYKNKAIDKIISLREKYPHNTHYLSIHNMLLEDPEQENQQLLKYLEYHPCAIDQVIDLISNLVRMGDFQKALYYCTNDYWGEQRPTGIKANEAWVYYERGEISKAISLMEVVVEENHNYYDGWRFLARWYDESRDSINVRRTAEECYRLHPNDSNVICYVAEKLQEHDPDNKSRILELLKRAFYLDPTSMYTGLSYIDYAIEMGFYEEALSSISLLKIHHDNAYVMNREMQIALLQKEQGKLPAMWQKVLSDLDANCWCMHNAMSFMKEASHYDFAINEIKQSLKDNVKINQFSGELLGLSDLEELGIAQFEKQLLSIIDDSSFYDYYLEAYLNHKIEQQKNIPSKLKSKLLPRFVTNTVTWGLYGHLQLILDNTNETRQWMADALERDDATAMHLYFYSIALRCCDRWNEARAVMKFALAKERDWYYDDILIWYLLDHYLAGDYMDVGYLATVPNDDIASLSRYPLSIIKALYQLQGRSFNEAYKDISPFLRDAQKVYVQEGSPPLSALVRNKTRHALVATIDKTGLQKWFWAFKVAIHF